MAETKTGQDKGSVAGAGVPAAGENKSVGLGIRLTPVDNSDQPVVANYSAVHVSPGIAFIDFGFIEPSVLAALPRMVQQGTKLPENINCRLAARVALGYDALTNLQQQLGQVLAGIQAASANQKKAG